MDGKKAKMLEGMFRVSEIAETFKTLSDKFKTVRAIAPSSPLPIDQSTSGLVDQDMLLRVKPVAEKLSDSKDMFYIKAVLQDPSILIFFALGNKENATQYISVLIQMAEIFLQSRFEEKDTDFTLLFENLRTIAGYVDKDLKVILLEFIDKHKADAAAHLKKNPDLEGLFKGKGTQFPGGGGVGQKGGAAQAEIARLKEELEEQKRKGFTWHWLIMYVTVAMAGFFTETVFLTLATYWKETNMISVETSSAITVIGSAAEATIAMMIVFLSAAKTMTAVAHTMTGSPRETVRFGIVSMCSIIMAVMIMYTLIYQSNMKQKTDPSAKASWNPGESMLVNVVDGIMGHFKQAIHMGDTHRGLWQMGKVLPVAQKAASNMMTGSQFKAAAQPTWTLLTMFTQGVTATDVAAESAFNEHIVMLAMTSAMALMFIEISVTTFSSMCAAATRLFGIMATPPPIGESLGSSAVAGEGEDGGGGSQTYGLPGHQLGDMDEDDGEGGGGAPSLMEAEEAVNDYQKRKKVEVINDYQRVDAINDYQKRKKVEAINDYQRVDAINDYQKRKKVEVKNDH